MLAAVPSASIHVSVTSSTLAPAKLSGAVTASWPRSAGLTSQRPSPRSVPAFRVQPVGTPLTVTLVRLPLTSHGLLSPRPMACPATPAGPGAVGLCNRMESEVGLRLATRVGFAVAIVVRNRNATRGIADREIRAPGKGAVAVSEQQGDGAAAAVGDGNVGLAIAVEVGRPRERPAPSRPCKSRPVQSCRCRCRAERKRYWNRHWRPRGRACRRR